jgi:hypothetical protein
MLFLNQNSNKIIKKNILLKKLKLRLQTGIHNVNKSGLKI